MGLFGKPSSLNANIHLPNGKKVRVNNVATKVGVAVDAMTGGKTNLKKVGAAIDAATQDVDIDIGKKK